MRKPDFLARAETALLISAFAFATFIVKSLYCLNLSEISSLYQSARFVSDLVGNPEDTFSLDAVQIYIYIYEPCHEETNVCICENKDADQLRGNREANQRLCFRSQGPKVLPQN